LHIEVRVVGPNRGSQRQTEGGSDDSRQNPWSTHT
jgi:hypothetical protein